MATDPWNQWKAFAEQTARANPTAAPIAELAQRFAEAARTFLQEAAQAPKGAAEQAAASFGNFLRDQSMAYFRFPWSGAGAGPAPDATGTPMADLPALGLMREHQLRWQRMVDAALRVADAQRRLQRLWADALRDAARDFAERICAAASSGGQAKNASSPDAAMLRGLYNSWIDCAERAYAEIAHSETFSSDLADFVNAGTCWRREFTASIEHWSKLIDLPTRSEVNSLNARLMIVEERLRAEHRRPAAREAPGERSDAPSPSSTAARPPAAREAPGKRSGAPSPSPTATRTHAAARSPKAAPATRPGSAATPAPATRRGPAARMPRVPRATRASRPRTKRVRKS